ncbi:MAG: endonuclease MutS2 [bacterium]
MADLIKKTNTIQEWDLIIEWISEKSHSEYGKKSLFKQKILEEKEAEKEFKMIKEIGFLIETSKSLFSFNLDTLSFVIEHFENNEPLEAKDYRVIGDFLTTVRKTGEEIKKQGWTENINSMFSFDFNISFEMIIKQCVNEKGGVNSNATPELFKIRKQLADTHKLIATEIKKMILSPEYSSYLQEDWFTIRDDRYVLPFKSVHKRTMKGVVHNYSRTGQTAFLEPLVLIELNNNLSLLAAKELEEIIKVLKELRGLVHRNYDYLQKCLEISLHIENLQTKYRWMKEFECVIPEFTVDEFQIKNGWYPPVFLAVKDALVKNDFTFSESEKIMVVSGPNAGGKTVALKTMATISSLAVRGFPVPCSYAKIPFFKEIFLIQGDNQSAALGESSFSSHLKLLSETSKMVTKKSFVLIDEIGTGTDPLQGGAIARAYLEFIAEKNCYAVVTSHLAEVKSIALESKNFIPVAMGFDDASDKPTYKFSYNIVGGSNALSLVKKIGFPPEFVSKLEKLLSTKESNVESLINRLRKKEKELNRLKKEAAELLAATAIEKEKASMIKESLEKKEKLFEAQRLNSLKRLLEMEEKELKKKISVIDKKEVPTKVALIKKEKENIKDAIARQQVSLDKKEGEKLSDSLESVVFGKSVVYDKLLKLEGILQQVKNNKAEYICSGKKLIAPVERLVVLAVESETKTSSSTNISTAKYAETCDVRGLFTEDALDKIEKALDDAFGGEAATLTIIHGHGSGKLKKFVRSTLPSLKKKYNFEFNPGESEEGGDAVTIIKFLK